VSIRVHPWLKLCLACEVAAPVHGRVVRLSIANAAVGTRPTTSNGVRNLGTIAGWGCPARGRPAWSAGLLRNRMLAACAAARMDRRRPSACGRPCAVRITHRRPRAGSLQVARASSPPPGRERRRPVVSATGRRRGSRRACPRRGRSAGCRTSDGTPRRARTRPARRV